MKSFLRRQVAGLVVPVLALASCIHDEVVNQGALLQVQVLQTFIPLGGVAVVQFTNRGSVDVYLRSNCASMKRKYGAEWRTPAPLVPLTACANERQLRRVSPGQSFSENVSVWSSTPASPEVTGEFKLSYIFFETSDVSASPYQVSTGTFTVGFPPD